MPPLKSLNFFYHHRLSSGRRQGPSVFRVCGPRILVVRPSGPWCRMFRLRIGRIRPDTPDFFWLSMFVSLMLMPRSAAGSPFFEASCWAGDVGLHKGMILFLPRLDQGLFSSVRGVCCLTLSGQVNPVLYIFFPVFCLPLHDGGLYGRWRLFINWHDLWHVQP